MEFLVNYLYIYIIFNYIKNITRKLKEHNFVYMTLTLYYVYLEMSLISARTMYMFNMNCAHNALVSVCECK